MTSKVLTLEIAGSSVGISSGGSPPAEWATSFLDAFAEIPAGVTLSVDLDTGNSDAGGLSLRCSDLSTILADLSVSATTTLDGDLTDSATSVDLINATTLSSSGFIWVGGEAIQYSGKVSNTLTGCTRGVYGTDAAAHSDADEVFTSNPTIFGRRCVLRWIDAGASTVSGAWTRFVGIVDSVTWQDGFYVLQILSTAQPVLDQVACRDGWLRGKLVQKYTEGSDLEIDTEQGSEIQTTLAKRGFYHLRVDDEVFRCTGLIYPRRRMTTTAYTAPGTFTVSNPEAWRVGQTVDVVNSSNVVQVEGCVVTQIVATSAANTVTLSNVPSTYSFTSGDQIAANYTIGIPASRITRGALDSVKGDHDVEAEVSEVRVFEGDAVRDVLLPLLSSDTGAGTFGVGSGAYDILPTGWGIGLPERYIDLEGLLEVTRSGRSGHRRYALTEGLQLGELFANIAMTCGCAVFFREDGQLTAKLWEDRYPKDAGSSVTVSEVVSPASARAGTNLLKNSQEILCDYDVVSGESRHTVNIEVLDSVNRYGRRSLTIDDPGLRSDSSLATIEGVLTDLLQLRALPFPLLTISVRIESGVDWRPGDIVDLTLAHLPNLGGAKGITGLHRVTSVTPSDASGYIDLDLWYMGAAIRGGYVAPAAVVSSVGESVTFEAGLTSLFAPQDLSDSGVLHDGDGQDDTDWFAVDDLIVFVDASSLGTQATATITAINYATRTITFDALPGWLAAGDFLRLDEYDAWAAAPPSTDEERRGVFLPLATGSPPDVDGDDPYVWGV